MHGGYDPQSRPVPAPCQLVDTFLSPSHSYHGSCGKVSGTEAWRTRKGSGPVLLVAMGKVAVSTTYRHTEGRLLSYDPNAARLQLCL